MRSRYPGGIRVQFRELVVASLAANAETAFKVLKTFAINPGLSHSFPWLSTLAGNFEQYIVHRISYEYVNAAPATRQGFIYLVPDYDTTDTAPGTAYEAVNQLGTKNGPVWDGMRIQLSQAAMMSLGPRRFIRQTVSSRDHTLTDVGQLHVGSSDFVDESLIPGQVYVEYDIELLVPQIVPQGMSAKTSAVFQLPTDDGNFTISPNVTKHLWDKVVGRASSLGPAQTGYEGVKKFFYRKTEDLLGIRIKPGTYEFLLDLAGNTTSVPAGRISRLLNFTTNGGSASTWDSLFTPSSNGLKGTNLLSVDIDDADASVDSRSVKANFTVSDSAVQDSEGYVNVDISLLGTGEDSGNFANAHLGATLAVA